MKELAIEAVEITKELGDVIFIGALATYMHTGSVRSSQDIDFVTENPIPDETLLEKHYHKSITGKQPWFTPRGLKIDIYTGDIPGVPFNAIVSHATTFPVGNKGDIRVLGLECLIINKQKAGRDQDVDDLQSIAQRRFGQINWNLVQGITNDEFVTSQIRRDMEYLNQA